MKALTPRVFCRGKLVIVQYFCTRKMASFPLCALFLHLKNGVFSPMLAMYKGYLFSEFFRRNDSVHLIAGNCLGVFGVGLFLLLFSAGSRNMCMDCMHVYYSLCTIVLCIYYAHLYIKQSCPCNLQEKSSRMRPAPKHLKHY